MSKVTNILSLYLWMGEHKASIQPQKGLYRTETIFFAANTRTFLIFAYVCGDIESISY